MSEQNHIEHNTSRRRFLRDAALAGVGLAAAPLLLTPQAAHAGGLFGAPSPADQKKVGDQAAQQILQQYHEVFDARAQHFNSIGQRLVRALPARTGTPGTLSSTCWTPKRSTPSPCRAATCSCSPDCTRSLSTDDALAGVTGHEMTHVRKQHWAQAQAKQQERDTLLAIGLSLFHAGQAAQTIAGLADSAIGLKFSRGEEDQADQGGLENMVAAGYNPQGMIQLFQALEKVSGNGGGLGGAFLSDHPLTSDRINHTAAADRGHAEPADVPAADAAQLQQPSPVTDAQRESNEKGPGAMPGLGSDG